MTHMTLTNVNVYVVCRNVNDQLFTLTAELTSGQCLAWRPICGIKKRKQSQSLKKSLCRRLFLSIILQNICSPCSSRGSYVEHPVKLLNGPCGEMMICSAAVEKVKPGWRGETAAAVCGWGLPHWPANTEVLVCKTNGMCKPFWVGVIWGNELIWSIRLWFPSGSSDFCVYFLFHLIRCISSSLSSSFVVRRDSSFVCFQVWRNPYICRKFAQLRNELTYTLYLCGDYN